MAKWDGLLRKKPAYLIVGIAIICLILGPILGTVLNKSILHQAKPEVITEDSSSYIREAFAQPVTLEKDQKLIIQISEYYINSSVTIIILSKSVYDLTTNITSPGSGLITSNRMDFVYSQFGWGVDPASSTTPVTVLSLPTTVRYAYIEFAGDHSGDYLISWPGDYVVVVYGTNSGDPTDINVSFDITIAVDGPGDLLSNIFILIGVFLLIFYFIAAIIVILRKNYFR